MTSASSVSTRPSVTRSLVGQKAVMAVTGAILFLFVVGHLLGNLKIFEGPAAFNAYAEGLRTVGAPFFGRGWLLWIARIVLLIAVLAHIWAAIATARARFAGAGGPCGSRGSCCSPPSLHTSGPRSRRRVPAGAPARSRPRCVQR